MLKMEKNNKKIDEHTIEVEIKHNILLPCTLIKYKNSKEEDMYSLISNEETKKITGNILLTDCGKTILEAEKKFSNCLQFILEYHTERSNELDLYKPFQKGDWKRIGGTWITIYGININFRYGNKMKGGFYIPFTKLNISITNHWKRKKKK